MKKKIKKSNFFGIWRTIIELIIMDKSAVKWLVIKSINGAIAGVAFGVVARYIEFFTQAAIDRDIEEFKRVSVIYILIILFVGLTRFLGPFAGNRYSMYTIRALKKKILNNIHALKINYFDDRHSGDTITKLSNDVEIVEAFVSDDMASIFGYLPGALGYSIAVLFSMNIKLTLIILPIVILSSFFIIKFSFRMREITKTRQKYVSNSNMILRDILENISIVKIYNLNRNFYEKHDKNLLAAQIEENKIYKNNQILNAMGYLMRMIPFIAAYLLGVLFISKGELTVPQLIAYTVLIMNSFHSFGLMYSISSLAAKTTGAMDHIKEITNETCERTDGNDYSMKENDIAFEFKAVSFKYNENIPVLSNISFSVECGKKVALVGESGCGKTTIVKLLLSQYDFYEGGIFINGNEISEWNLNSLRSAFSYVSQDEYLFSDSIRNNILYGNINADEEQFIHVCELTGVNEIAEEQEDGYDGQIGERGSSLSGGQRQRIALARALIGEKKFIILDEPTSNLDTRSEFYIEKAISNIGGEKTIVIIAHRLSTIINCDEILVVSDGKIAEQGKHDQLINKKGEYYNLYNRQSIK